MSKLYAKSVVSNVKRGVEVELGPKTLIVGPNGSGKSAIINSLELALGGFASDIVGRAEMAREIDLMALARNGSPSLFSQVTLSDGSKAVYEAGGEKKKARRVVPPHISSDFVFPLRAVREALLGSAATTRKFFLSYASATLTKDDITAALSADFRKMYLDALPMVSGTYASEQLLGVLEFARKRGNDEARAAKMTKAAVNTVSRDLPPEPSESEIATAQAAVNIAQKALDEAVREEMRHQRTMDERASAERRVKTAADKLTAIISREGDLVRQLQEAQAAAEAAREKIAHFPIQSALDVLDHQPVGDPCLLCGGETTVQSVLDAQEILKEALKDNASAQEAISRYNTISARCEQHVRETEAAQKELDSATNALVRYDGLTHSELPNQEILRGARESAQAKLTALLQAKAAWASATKVIDAAVDADVSSTEWKKLALVLEKLVAHFLEQGVVGFTTKVQKFLPEGDQFMLRLQDGEREVCQFGFVRNGHLHTALSGSEWARMNAALASACKYGDLNIIIPEDRAWDAQTLLQAMDAFLNVEGQVIIATTVTAIQEYGGWDIIHTA